MNDFEISMKCVHCGSTEINVKAIGKYDGDIVLEFKCIDCDAVDTWGILDEIKWFTIL